MTFANDLTMQLWQRFGALVRTIPHRSNNNRISMTVYAPTPAFLQLTLHTPFEKWAAVEVQRFEGIPDGLRQYIIPGGLYANFTYKGTPAAFGPVMEALIKEWMPANGVEPDHRPFFEQLGPNYHPANPDAEEEVWIPIRSI